MDSKRRYLRQIMGLFFLMSKNPGIRFKNQMAHGGKLNSEACWDVALQIQEPYCLTLPMSVSGVKLTPMLSQKRSELLASECLIHTRDFHCRNVFCQY